MENDKAIWVRGNRQPLLIPLEQEVIRQDGEVINEPYYPEGGATVNVYLVGRKKKYHFRPTVDGNLLSITDNGNIPAGCYGLEVTVINEDDTPFRSYWPDQVVVTDSNPSVLEEWNEFKQQGVQARAALFFFAKGGDGPVVSGSGEGSIQMKDTGANASGKNACALGQDTTAEGNEAFALGDSTVARGNNSVAEGHFSHSEGSSSHAEGKSTTAAGDYSHAEGNGTEAGGDNSHAEGSASVASGNSSHAEGVTTSAEGEASHAGGTFSVSEGNNSFAHGDTVTAHGVNSHAEGERTNAVGMNSHVEGESTEANGRCAHAEGFSTQANDYSHAEGRGCEAMGMHTHAEGFNTFANGQSSHAQGENTQALHHCETAMGRFNKSNSQTRFSIGIGTSEEDRKNAVEIMEDGRVYIIGLGGYDGTNPDAASSLQSLLSGNYDNGMLLGTFSEEETE